MSNFGGWLFQCNPRQFRVFDAVADGMPIENWSASQHRGEMAVGDQAALWISANPYGYPAGIYGTGTIRSLSWDGQVDSRYWTGPGPGPDHFVDIDFDRWAFHHPVGVDELRRDRDFSDARILRMPRATNFPLTVEQWHAIERRILKRRPTVRPTLTRHIGSLGP